MTQNHPLDFPKTAGLCLMAAAVSHTGATIPERLSFGSPLALYHHAWLLDGRGLPSSTVEHCRSRRVQQAAAADSAAIGILDWSELAGYRSTASVDAISHINVQGLQRCFVDGTKSANNAADLWDGTLLPAAVEQLSADSTTAKSTRAQPAGLADAGFLGTQASGMIGLRRYARTLFRTWSDSGFVGFHRARHPEPAAFSRWPPARRR